MKKLLICVITFLLFQDHLFSQLTVSITLPAQCFVAGTTATAIVTGTPAGAASYSWTVTSGISICISGNTVTVVNPTMALITFGCCCNKSITCSAYASNNSLISSTVTPIVLQCNTNFNATSNPSLVCAGGGTTTLAASGTASYSWSTGATGPQATVSVLSASVYTVTGTFSTGCTTTKTVAVNAFSPAVQTTPQSATICAGGTLALGASGASSYTWTSPGGLQNPFQNIVVSPLVNSTYTLAATSQSSGVNCLSSATVPVTVISALTITAAATPTAACAGAQATLSASGASTYTWSTLQQGSVVTTMAPLSGQATFTVVGSSGGCPSNAFTVNLAVLPLPTVAISAGNPVLCAGESNTLTANGAQTYTWSNSVVAPSITITAVNGADYSVTGVGANGCESTATYTLAVNPQPTITAVSNRTLICAGEKIILTPGGGATYTWAPVTGSASLALTPGITTEYTLHGTSSAGCTGSAQVLVTVNKCTAIGEVAIEPVRIYPNPASNVIYIETNERATITLRNVTGQVQFSSTLPQPVNHIDVSGLAPGCYFITLETPSQKRNVKFIKE
jgi:hypothetical protein